MLGLKYLHSQQVVHRDLKPQNILYSQKGKKFMLCDFGISARLANTLNKAYSIVGTGIYAAPE